MGRHDDASEEEGLGRHWRKPFEPTLDDEAVVPVLLALSALALRPAPSRDLADQASHDDRDRREESAPVAVGAASMHAATVRTAPALDPQRLENTVEVAKNEAMSPKPMAVAARTSLRPGPGVELAQT
jgi:hypothetical protein